MYVHSTTHVVLITLYLYKFGTDKVDHISVLFETCTTVDTVKGKLMVEYWKTRPMMCMDHRLLTRVMESNALMGILGLSNPCVTRETKKGNKVMIINRDWMNGGLLDENISSGSTGDTIAERLEKFLKETTTPPQHWSEDDLNNLEKVVTRMNEMGEEVYGEK